MLFHNIRQSARHDADFKQELHCCNACVIGIDHIISQYPVPLFTQKILFSLGHARHR